MPPVVGGAPWCLRCRFECKLKFAKKSRDSRAKNYCCTRPSCSTRRHKTHSRSRYVDCESKWRNRLCRKRIVRWPSLQQFLVCLGRRRRPTSGTARSSVQTRHRQSIRTLGQRRPQPPTHSPPATQSSPAPPPTDADAAHRSPRTVLTAPAAAATPPPAAHAAAAHAR